LLGGAASSPPLFQRAERRARPLCPAQGKLIAVPFRRASTQLYDRRREELTLDEIERIAI
jgi:hypothetical protein